MTDSVFPGDFDDLTLPLDPGEGLYVWQDGTIRDGVGQDASIVVEANPALIHENQHALAFNAIAALQAKVGVDDSEDPDSLDYKVARKQNIVPGLDELGPPNSFPTVNAEGDGVEYVHGTNQSLQTVDPVEFASVTGGNLTEGRVLHAGADGIIDDDSNHVWDDTNKRVGVQVSTPKATHHAAAAVGTTIADVTTGSISLVTETLPSAPTGSVTAIAMPSAGSSGTASYTNGGAGSAFSANGTSRKFRVYPCLLVAALGIYYRSQSYEELDAGMDANDSQSYDVAINATSVAIAGESVYYFIEYEENGSGSWSAVGLFPSASTTLTSLSGSDSTTPWPTFYTHATTPPPDAPTSFDSATQVYDGSMSYYYASGQNIQYEIDQYKNIGGTNYVSGSPVTYSFTDDSSGNYYSVDLAWTLGGSNYDGVILRKSTDGGTTWAYQNIGNASSYSDYNFSDDGSGTMWGNTYSGGSSTSFDFYPYATAPAPGGATIFSPAGALYGATISDSNYYILKHTFSGATSGKVVDEALGYGNLFSGGVLYDAGYTSWGYGPSTSPSSYGFTGTNQNREYEVYAESLSLGIFSQTPLVLSTTAGSGSKYVSITVSYPSGQNRIKIRRRINGGAWSGSKTITSPTTTVTDDATDTSWSGNTTVTPNAVVGTAGRYDRDSTAVTNQPILAVVATGSGTRYPKISFGVADNSASDASYQAHIHAESSTGHMTITTNRLNVGSSLGATPAVLLGDSNVINNANSSSSHFQVKGSNDSYLINTRSDQDTLGLGQQLGTDESATVVIQPARSSDTSLVFKGHSSMTDSSNVIRIQDSGGSYKGEITQAGWWRGGTGASANPSLSCRSDTNTGNYFPSSDVMGTVCGGVEQQRSTTAGNLVRVGTAPGAFAKIGGTINVNTSAVGNVGTGEDNLISYTLPANALTTNGDRLIIRASGTFAANANNKRVKLYFGTQVLFDTTALAFNSGDWCLEAEVIRTGATTQKAWARWISSNTTLGVSMDYTTPAMTLTNSQAIKCTGEATSNNDIVQETFSIEYKPA